MTGYWVDILAVGFFALEWLVYAVTLEHTAYGRDSLSARMHVYREIWVRNLLHRDARMVDMQIMASLQNGTAFFASTSLIAIGGALASGPLLDGGSSDRALILPGGSGLVEIRDYVAPQLSVNHHCALGGVHTLCASHYFWNNPAEPTPSLADESPAAVSNVIVRARATHSGSAVTAVGAGTPRLGPCSALRHPDGSGRRTA